MKKLLSIILACLGLTLMAENMKTQYLEYYYSWTCEYCNKPFNCMEIWWKTIRYDNYGNILWSGRWNLKHISECPRCSRKPTPPRPED